MILPLIKKSKKGRGNNAKGGKDDVNVAPAARRFTTVCLRRFTNSSLPSLRSLSGAREPKVLARTGRMRCNDRGH